MTGFYPCPWDDLIDEKSKVYATVYTLNNVRKDSWIGIRKAGIIFNKKDKIFDIVVDVPKLTEKIVLQELEKLSKITSVQYRLGKAKKRYVSVDL